MWDFGLYYLLLCTFLYKNGYSKARKRAFDQSEKQTKHRDRLIPPLVEFHKTQCFFMFAVQISAMVSMKARLFDATTLQQLRNNYCVVTVLAFGGLVPVTFILSALRVLHQNSWYMLFLSAVTVSMSAATYYTASNFNLSAKDISTSGTSYKGCGFVNPTALCLTHGCEQYGTNRGLDQEGAIILSLIVILLLFLERCRVEQWPGLSKVCEPYTARFGKVGQDILFGCLGFIVIVFHFVYFVQYLQDLTTFAKFSIGNSTYKYYGAVEIFNSFEWSFGQIVALVVWMPPICEYIVLELGMFKLWSIETPTEADMSNVEGLAEGSAYRFPRGWILTRRGSYKSNVIQASRSSSATLLQITSESLSAQGYHRKDTNSSGSAIKPYGSAQASNHHLF